MGMKPFYTQGALPSRTNVRPASRLEMPQARTSSTTRVDSTTFATRPTPRSGRSESDQIWTKSRDGEGSEQTEPSL
jgi:hypothetical protein